MWDVPKSFERLESHPGMGSRQFCLGRGRRQGRKVEAEARQGRAN